MLKNTLIAILFLLALVAFKTSDWTLIKSIPLKASFFTTDNLGNIYAVRKDILEKYDAQGNNIKTYSNKNLGEITFVDASNPLKLVLFYKDFYQILFLDNTLSIQGKPVSLEQYGLEQSTLLCSSYNNGLWIYNQQNFELNRLDNNLQRQQQTGNISQLLGIRINPNYMTEYNNRIYLNDPAIGILVFDAYGTYYNTIHLKGLNNFQLYDDALFYYANNKLKTYHLKTMEEQTFNLPDSLTISVRIERKKMFFLKENSLDIYTIK